jgi:hypothetical protein
MSFARAKLLLLLLILPALILPGGRLPRRALPNDAYIWQRRWTPVVVDAIELSSDQIRAWRVLVAEADGRGNWWPAAVDWAALKRSYRPVIIVVRIDGQLTQLNESPLVDDLVRIIDRSRDAAASIAGIEIDHDCATARLEAYAQFLATVRARLGNAIPLSITALPTWLGSPAVDHVFAQADEIELQVHAVRNPRFGLFNRNQAHAWIAQIATRTNKPFRVALPAYGSRVSWRTDGTLVAIEAEMPLLAGGDSATELMASPQEVAALVRDLRDDPPAGLIGIAWFRLPTSDDRRAWSLTTWRAVMRGAAAPARIEAQVRQGATTGMNLLVLSNTGDRDADLPRRVELPRACAIGDGANGYTREASDAHLALRREEIGLLRGHHQQVIGWMRCAPATREIYVQP